MVRRRSLRGWAAVGAVLALALAAPPAGATGTVLVASAGNGSGAAPPGEITPVDAATNVAGAGAPTASFAGEVVVDPLGGFAYVDSHAGCSTNPPPGECGTISQTQLAPSLATTSYTYVDPAFADSEGGSYAEAISPDGSVLYAMNQDDTVDELGLTTSPPTLTQAVFGNHSESGDMVISPDGTTAWLDTDVSNTSAEQVVPFSLASSSPTAGTAVDLGGSYGFDGSMVFSPDGSRLYVTEGGHYDNTIEQWEPSHIAVLSVTAPGTATLIDTITLAGSVEQLVMAPDGKTLYAIDGNYPSYGTAASAVEGVEVVDISGDANNDQVVASYQPSGVILQAGAIAPDGNTLYVTNGATTDGGSGTNDLLAIPLPITGSGPAAAVTDIPINQGTIGGVTVTPDLPVAAAFSSPGGQAGTPVTFTSSSAPTSNIASYTWNFGDGSQQQTTTTPTVQHTYSTANSYDASLTVTDLAGTSTQPVFNGHEMLRNGNATATETHSVLISPGSGPPPAPIASLSAGLTFPGVPAGQATPNQTVTVTNTGTAALQIAAGGVALAGLQPSAFHIASDSCSGASVQPTDTCTVSLNFKAPVSGKFSALVAIADDANGSPQQVTLSGTVLTAPLVSLDHASLAFGSVVAGRMSASQSVAATNVGQSPLIFPSNSVTSSSGEFAILADGCSGHTIGAGASCSVTVGFDPTAVGSATATLSLSDNAFDSPQSVSLSGTGTCNATICADAIVGDVLQSDSQSGIGSALAGATVFACPQATLEARGCVTTISGADGRYQLLNLTAGPWVVQVDPPSRTLFGGSALVTVVPSGPVEQDFTLRPPLPLSSGMTFDGQSSGVPTFYFNSPYTLNVPLPIAGTGPPNTTQMFTGFAGVDAATQSATPAGQSFQAGMILFAARYGSDGHIEGISDPAIAPVNCGLSAAQAAACARLGALSPSAQSSADTARSRRFAGPIARPADTTPANYKSIVKETVTPNSLGGVDMTDTYDDGTTSTIVVAQAQIPTLAGPNPWSNAAINLGNAALNVTPAGWYNAGVGAINALSNATQNAGSNAANAAAYYASAGWQLASQGFGARYHGAVSLVWNLTAGDINTVITGSSPTTITVTSGTGGQASGYADPSGTVATPSGIPVANATVTLRRTTAKTRPLQTVPNGSVIMSPGNRRNPDRTNALGFYGWDVLPGFYQITATRRDCTDAHSRTAKSKLLPVPPAQTGVNLVLNCPHLRRATVKLRLTITRSTTRYAPEILHVAVSGGRGHPQGTVTFTAGRKHLAVVLLSPKTGKAVLAVPRGLHIPSKITATYNGDGSHKPASAHARR